MSASLASLMYTFMGLPLLCIVVLNVIGKKPADRICPYLGLFVGLVQMVSAVVSAVLLLQFNKEAVNFSQFWNMNVSAEASFFSVDMISLVVLFCIGMVTMVSFATAKSMLKENIFKYTNLMCVLVLGMNGIALVSDLFSLYVFIEITGIASFILIAVNKDDNGLEGAFKYLVMSCIASAFMLAGLALLFMEAGGLRFEQIHMLFDTMIGGGAIANPVLVILGVIFLIAGFSIKSGIVPFHGWLPDAYQSASAPVSVILGGVVTKVAGVYAIIRLMGDFMLGSFSIFSIAFMILALVSIVVGALAAVAQKDFKRILAYSSISQIGYIVLGVATGSIIGLVGAVMHFFNHATFKTTLFVNASSIEKQVGTTEIAKLGGLQKQMPVTGVSSILAFFSTAGIPPLAGFWSKLLIIIAAWSVSPVAGGVALVASLFTIAYFLRLQRSVFFGPEEEHLSEVKEAKGGLRVASILLSAVTVLVGVLFPVLLLILQAQGVPGFM